MYDSKLNGYTFFFSGTEPNDYFDMVSKETNTMLMSYLYIRNKGVKILEERYEKCPGLKILLDSGAFTFNTSEEYQNKEKYDLAYWEKHVDIYAKFIRKHKEHIFAAVELDIEYLVGLEKVDEWREKYFRPLEKEGIQIIYVWHEERGLSGWEDMCKRFPYVGMTFAVGTINEQNVIKMFNIAKKYRTLVHGFAVSGGYLLTKFPFYTSDSSTWLVGTQYGEISFFEGRKLSRLKKAKWKTIYKSRLIRLGANWTLLEREDAYEMQRVCMLAFIELEKYVRKSMFNKWYWKGGNKEVAKKLKLKKKVIEEKSEEIEETENVEEIEKPEEEVPRGTLPPIEWFRGEMEDWEKYASAANISTNYSKEEATSILTNFYNFINENKLDQYTTEECYALCNFFEIPTSEANTRAKAITAVTSCFKKNLDGVRNDFAVVAEEVGEAAPRAKEREEYVEDEDFVTVEITKKECDSILAGFLPSGMPEVDEYDEELKKFDIQVVRDEKGRFLKGQQKVRKPKSVYSNKLPQVSCDVCAMAQGCPDYKPGYICAYNKMFKKFDTRNLDDLKDAMHSIVSSNLERLQRMMLMEQLNGGIADATVDRLMDTNMKYLQMMKELDSGSRVVAQQRVVIKDDGTTETVTSVTSNPVAGGILSKLFAQPSSKEDFIDITPDKE